jgi:predicted outer membrane repeat protein
MNGGEIFNNSSSGNGGGVYVSSSVTFTMNGGEISGNSAFKGGGVYVSGGTNFSYGTIRITNGTIYGSGEALGFRNYANTSGAGAALNSDYFGLVQYGTFTGSTWNRNGSLDTTDNTIRVVNGVLQ